MSATPYQTYLEERLQSARGLGWEVTVGRGEARTASNHTTVADALRHAHQILRFWLGFAR
ncbi:MAG: hypothetical protein PHD37_16950 [Gallionellaceae bacterium]|nr:hypothetical protein [Gallionellaceae bacterium]